MISVKYGDNSGHFQTVSLKTFIVLRSVVHMTSDTNSCVKNEKGELKREVQTLDLFSPPHSWPITFLCHEF